jgi:hypothetical protein
MTIKEEMLLRMDLIGLIAYPANMAMRHAMDTIEEMEGRWEDSTSGYPPELIQVIWMAVSNRTGEWLDVNFPQFPGRRHFGGKKDAL